MQNEEIFLLINDVMCRFSWIISKLKYWRIDRTAEMIAKNVTAELKAKIQGDVTVYNQDGGDGTLLSLD